MVPREARWHIGVSSASESEGPQLNPCKRLNILELEQAMISLQGIADKSLF